MGISPFLTVRGAARAADFYRRAFGATERSRLTTPSGQHVIVMELAGAELGVVDEDPRAFNLSPEALGGTSVRLSLVVDDPDAWAARAVEAGATVVFPVADQPYGMRQGRVQDPFGHLWLIGKDI
ncbi:MAG TPA: VOC family protein [Candidatus Limnocylindria bacterium]|nr:VOC family protein [Candidatus Limnocylindria bacterium]